MARAVSGRWGAALVAIALILGAVTPGCTTTLTAPSDGGSVSAPSAETSLGASPGTESSSWSLSPIPSLPPSVSAASVVCQFFTGEARSNLLDSMRAEMTGDNPAQSLRAGIQAIEALAASATDPTEKRDLQTLAAKLDEVAMAGGGFGDWDPAYEAFFVKYAERCGQPLAS